MIRVSPGPRRVSISTESPALSRNRVFDFLAGVASSPVAWAWPVSSRSVASLGRVLRPRDVRRSDHAHASWDRAFMGDPE
jgi:hypothetical protein